MYSSFGGVAVALIVATASRCVYGAAPLQPRVEAEEDIYSYRSATNGAGPLWCHGSSCLVRVGTNVFASGLETLRGVKPLNNCKWTLFARTANNWQLIPVEDGGRTREPSPLAAFADGRFFLSANPTLLTNLDTYSGPAEPKLLEFQAEHPAEFRTQRPRWDGQPSFSEHSYRSLAADGPNRELLLLQNIDYSHAEWSFLDRKGVWSAQGKLRWPVENAKPIRLCYPNVALRNRAVYFCGTSDIVEPNEEWRTAKKQLTGQEWDYTFRRLFYNWSSDVTSSPFHAWIELVNLDQHGGGITLGDLWAAPDGIVHLLWSERKMDERLRDKFFPGEKQRYTLVYARVREGTVLSRQILVEANEGGKWEIPARARFQVTPENRLFVVFYVSGRDATGRSMFENRVLELSPNGQPQIAVRIPLQHPMTEFMTATVRAGSPPSNILDLLGQTAGSQNTISYARVRLLND